MPEHAYLPWPLFRRSGVAAFDRSLTATEARCTGSSINTKCDVSTTERLSAILIETRIPRYIVRLFGQVVRVAVETQKVIASLSAVSFAQPAQLG